MDISNADNKGVVRNAVNKVHSNVFQDDHVDSVIYANEYSLE